MAKAFFFKLLFFFFYRILFRKLKTLRRSFSNSHAISNSSSFSSSVKKLHKFHTLSSHRSDDHDELSNAILIFNVERSLLKSSSMFPYFMLVAFEAGGLFRSLLLFVMYPFICLLSQEMGLKVMVMICFFGIKKKSFRVGTAVLPKFYLEDVGFEIFEVLQRGSKRVAFTDFPVVMVESFLRDYLQIDVVVGRELKVFGGYYLGIMEETKKKDIHDVASSIDEIIVTADQKGSTNGSDVIGITDFNSFCDHHQLFSHCKVCIL